MMKRLRRGLSLLSRVRKASGILIVSACAYEFVDAAQRTASRLTRAFSAKPAPEDFGVRYWKDYKGWEENGSLDETYFRSRYLHVSEFRGLKPSAFLGNVDALKPNIRKPL